MKKIFIITLLNVAFMNTQAQSFQWSTRAGSYAYDYGLGISTDNGGNVYIAGKYEMNANFNGTYVPCQGNHDIYLAKYTPSGALSWVRTAGGYTGDYAKTVACDGANFVYIAGEIEGAGATIKFIGSPITLKVKGWNDAFLAKYDLNGNLKWARSAGGYANDEALGITYDNAGNVYICGFFMNQATYGSTTISGYGGYDISVAKYDANGNFLWVRKAGGPGNDEARSIKCDAAGNVYVCGLYKGTATFGTQTLSNNSGYYDGFLAKYDPAGNLIWVKKMGGAYDDVAYSLTMDNAGLIYIAGEFNSYATFGGIGLSTAGGSDVFVACYNSSGNALWVKRAGGSGTDRARGIGCDGTNLFITGQFSYAANFGSTPLYAADASDIFIAALNNSGTFLWARSVGGAPDGVETLGFESGCAIAARAGSVWATGATLNGGTFGSTPLYKFGRSDIFLTKLYTSKSMQGADSSSVSSGSKVDSVVAKAAALALKQSAMLAGNDSTHSTSLEDALDNNTDIIPRNSSWKYLDDGTNQGKAWRANEFDDAAWKTGMAEFGYGNGSENTLVSYGSSPTNKFITTYFRKQFDVTDKSTISGLELNLLRDDGAVVYINGQEVYRTNLPSGIIHFNTLAPEVVDAKDEASWDITNIGSNFLINGNNVLAVEIHQNAVTSADIRFNIKLNATGINPNDTLTGEDKLLLAKTLNENTISLDEPQQIKIPEDKYDMIVYPNPTTGQFNLELCIDDLAEKTLLIEVTNSFGKTVYMNQPKKINGCVNEVISLAANLPLGLYVLKVSIDNKIETKNMLLAR